MSIRDEAHCISSVHGLITCKQEEAETKIILCAKFAAFLSFQLASTITSIINIDLI